MAEHGSENNQLTSANSMLAGIFNIVVPGSGYIFRGQTSAGVFALTAVTAALVVPNIPLPIAFVVWLLMIGDCIDESLQQHQQQLSATNQIAPSSKPTSPDRAP